MSKHNAYRDGRIHVCEKMCPTCIYRPGNLMSLADGAVEQMENKAIKKDSSIICHATLDGDNSCCRGFYDRHETLPLLLAKKMGLITFTGETK